MRRHRETTEQKLVSGILRGVWYFLKLPFLKIKSKDAGLKIDQAEISLRQQRIEQLRQTGQIANLRTAVIEADNLLDFILKTRVSGDSLGERLKKAENLFAKKEDYQAAWEGHKVRNRLVHGEGEVLLVGLEQALTDFKKAFEGLINKIP
ncbi:hypothetical protein HYU72_01370 [Candidatus Berkelbacteria bacterium]|nr:hypothetical protein [Candidatus Berkelbacteria bacterium]